MKNYFKNLFDKLHLNFKKELLIVITSNLLTIILGIVLFILFKQINYIVLMFILLILINLIILYRYIYINSKNNLSLLNEVNNAFRYFYLDINNGVDSIKAINNMKNHCSITMNDNINLLLDEIKIDNTFAPFIKFAKKYHPIILEELILATYQLTISNSKENILIFNKSYIAFKEKVEGIYSNTYKKQFSFINLTPVIGTMIITILVIVSTILLIRGYLNG